MNFRYQPALPSHFGTVLPRALVVSPFRLRSLTPSASHFSSLLLVQSAAKAALFCTPQKPISCPFKHIHTLSAKTPGGWGTRACRVQTSFFHCVRASRLLLTISFLFTSSADPHIYLLSFHTFPKNTQGVGTPAQAFLLRLLTAHHSTTHFTGHGPRSTQQFFSRHSSPATIPDDGVSFRLYRRQSRSSLMRFDTIIRNGTVVTATDTFLADVGIAGEKNSAVEVLLLPESVLPLLVDFGSLGRVTDGYGRERRNREDAKRRAEPCGKGETRGGGTGPCGQGVCPEGTASEAS